MPRATQAAVVAMALCLALAACQPSKPKPGSSTEVSLSPEAARSGAPSNGPVTKSWSAAIAHLPPEPRAKAAAEHCRSHVPTGYGDAEVRVKQAHRAVIDVYEVGICFEKAKARPDPVVLAAIEGAKRDQLAAWKAASAPLNGTDRKTNRVCFTLGEEARALEGNTAGDRAAVAQRIVADVEKLVETLATEKAAADRFIEAQAEKRRAEIARYASGPTPPGCLDP